MMDKIQVTENIQIEQHQLEELVQDRVNEMSIDSLKEHAYEHLVEYYKNNPEDLQDYFDEE